MVGDYRVLDLIGSGGMGHVYKVQNVLSNRIEAMKIVLPDKAEELSERFLREIQVQASLFHPNITGLHTALRVDGQLVMLMELVEGETVKDRLARGPMRIGECLEYGRQILDALAYAHRHHVVHRDIKPANIMLSPNGQAKLMDFGLASGSFDRRLTRSGMVMGSLYYMAPEQVKGQPLSTKSDIYSFGLTLYEMLTGVRGIQGDSDYAIMTAQLAVTPDSPKMFNPAVSEGLSDLVLRAVAKDPEDRFGTAEEFRDALEKFARAAPEPVMEAVAAKPDTLLETRESVPPAPLPAPPLPSFTSTTVKPDSSTPAPSFAPQAGSSAVPQKKSGTLIMVGAAAAVILAAAGVYRFATAPAATSPNAPAPAVTIESAAVNPSGTGSAPSTPSAQAAKPIAIGASNAAAPVASTQEKPAAAAVLGRVVEPAKPPQKSADELLAEEAARAWDLISTSSDLAVLRAFQSKYPQSAQAQEALSRAENLERGAAAEAAVRNAADAARATADATAALRNEVVPVLQRLELAYSARNMAQIRMVWPSIDEEHVKNLEQVFRDSRMVSLTLEPRMDPRRTPNGPLVNCRYVLAMPAKNPPGPRRVEGVAVVHFKRTGKGLVVDSIEYRVTNKSLFSPL